MKTKKITILFSLCVFLISCVPLKKFNNLKNSYEQENSQLRKVNMETTTLNTELSNQVKILKSQMDEKSKQYDEALYNLDIQRKKAEVIEKEKAELQKQFDALNAGSSQEIEKLITQLQNLQSDIKLRESKLATAEKELNDKNKKLVELETLLAQKDKAVKELKQKVVNALTGFSNNGLTVNEKNGKIYVSMDEKLLFKTGKWDVDPNGQKAIKELSNVLAQNSDIEIMVEGHTDDVAMKGSGDVKDNWDLSVMRATAVTKILTQNKLIDPSRIVSAGRSEYSPLSMEKSAEARQINRRTEIILTPKIDELLKLIGQY